MAFIKMRMRTEFIVRNGLDILLLQEVVTENLYPIYGYTIHINIGTERRGTASDPGFDAFTGHRKITKVILKNIIAFMLEIVHFRVLCAIRDSVIRQDSNNIIGITVMFV
jgi:hypothetical protein